MKYRKKPVEVEAVQWTGENFDEIEKFCPDAYRTNYYDNFINCFDPITGNFLPKKSNLMISTLEGPHYATIGDYIIKGVHGEFYPCKPDIFHETYEVVE